MTGEKRMIVGVDVDDSLGATTGQVITYVNQVRGVNLTEQDYRVQLPYSGYYEQVWASHGIDSTGLLEGFHEDLISGKVIVPKMPGSEVAIQSLRDECKFVAITARPPGTEGATEAWLGNEFDGAIEGVIFTHATGKSKGQICREIGAVLLIEDNVDHCRTAIEYGVGAILVGEYGWHVDVTEEMIRCPDWDAITGHFGSVSRV